MGCLKRFTKLKIKILKIKDQGKIDYSIINYILILIFIIGALYVLFSKGTVKCFYKENYDILCKTCGLTRDFKSMAKLDFSNLINPISVYYYTALILVFTSRFISLRMLMKNVELKRILTFDITIAALVIGMITVANIVLK